MMFVSKANLFICFFVLFSTTSVLAQSTENAANPCIDPKESNENDRRSELEIVEHLNATFSRLSGCTKRIDTLIGDLLKGDGNDEDWNKFNLDLRALSDQYTEEMEKLRGSNGSLEKIERLVDKMKRELESLNDNSTNYKSLSKRINELEGESNLSKEHIDDINKAIVLFIAHRPEIARKMREESIDSLITAIKTQNKNLKDAKQGFTDMLEKHSIVPETSN